QRRDAVPGRFRLLLPHRGRLHQRVADARQRASAPGHAARPPERDGAADVRRLRPLRGARRARRRAGLGGAVDEPRQTRHARHHGGRRDRLPDGSLARPPGPPGGRAAPARPLEDPPDGRTVTAMTTHKGHVDATDSMPQVADAQVAEAPVAEAPVAEAQAPAAAPPGGPARTAVARLTALRAPRPAWQGLLAFAAYLAAFLIVYARPLIAHLNTPELRQYWTDPNFYTWAMQWWPWALSHGVNPLFSSQIGAPHGYDLAWASTTPSVDVLMWPATAAFGVLVSYNIMLLLVPPLSAWACFLAARRLTGRFWPSLLAGAVYGFCPYELVHDWQGQPNLTVIALFPLMAYLVLRWRDGALADGWFVV